MTVAPAPLVSPATVRVSVLAATRPVWLSLPALAALVATPAERVAIAVTAAALLAPAAAVLTTGWLTPATVDAAAWPSDPAAALTADDVDCTLDAVGWPAEVAAATVWVTGVTVWAVSPATVSALAVRGPAATALGVHTAMPNRQAIPTRQAPPPTIFEKRRGLCNAEAI
jgi:hypothetical protein